MLSGFLREHYTASSDQAAALAAYVLGAGGSEPAPKQKPDVEHARADEPKAGEPKAAEPKTAEPKTPSHPVRAAAKPEKRSGRNRRPSARNTGKPARPGKARGSAGNGKPRSHAETGRRGA